MSAASFAPASSNRLQKGLLALFAGLLLSLSAFAQPKETLLYSSTAEDIALAKLVLQELGAQPSGTPGPDLMVRAARRLLGEGSPAWHQVMDALTEGFRRHSIFTAFLTPERIT